MSTCIKRSRDQEAVRWGILALSFLSWFFTIISIQRCSFVLSGEEGTPNQLLYSWGLFSSPAYQDGVQGEHNLLGCIAYPSSVTFGRAFKIARAFGVMLVLLMTTIVFLIVFLQLFIQENTTPLFQMFRGMLICALVCQLLTLVAFGADFCYTVVRDGLMAIPAKCVPGAAGIVGIFNCLILALLSAMSFMVPPPKHPFFQVRRYPRSKNLESCHLTDSASEMERAEKRGKYMGVDTNTTTVEKATLPSSSHPEEWEYAVEAESLPPPKPPKKRKDPSIATHIESRSRRSNRRLDPSIATHNDSRSHRSNHRLDPSIATHIDAHSHRAKHRTDHSITTHNDAQSHQSNHILDPSIATHNDARSHRANHRTDHSIATHNDAQSHQSARKMDLTQHKTRSRHSNHPPNSKRTTRRYSSPRKLDPVGDRAIMSAEEASRAASSMHRPLPKERRKVPIHDNNAEECIKPKKSTVPENVTLPIKPIVPKKSTKGIPPSDGTKKKAATETVKVTVEHYAGGKKTYKEIIHADGSKHITTITETIHTDGSKTVKSVVEEIDAPDSNDTERIID